MQIKSLALVFATSSMAMAQSSGPDLVSIYQVLATALPSSLVAEALTNSAAVSSEIASEFSIGATPSWFAALPTDIQTYLNPPVPTNVSGAGSSAAALQTSHFSSLIANATAIANATMAGVAGAGANATMTSAAGAGITPVANASVIGHNTTGLAGLQSSFRSMNSSLSAAASSNIAGAAGSSGRATTTAASGSGSGSAAGAGASGASATASRSSSAGAAVHTAVGFGVAGIAGIVGLLAL